MESHQQTRDAIAGTTTQNAQLLGWRIGQLKFMNGGLQNIMMRIVKLIPGIDTFIKPYTRGNIHEQRKK